MPIDTANLSQSLELVTLRAKDFDFLPFGVVSGDAALATKAAFDLGFAGLLLGSNDSTVRCQEISTLGVNGALMNTDGDLAHTAWAVPPDFDEGKPCYVRVCWVSGSTDVADTVLWKVTYKLLTVNVTALSATVTTALDTVVPVDTIPLAQAYTVAGTRGGTLNANKVGAATSTLLLAVEMDTKDTDMSEDLYFYGLQIAYHRKVKTAGRGRVLVNPWP
jgi:hypothetical protein